MERFHFNPIPLNQYPRRFFPNIETFHIYKEEDKIIEDGRIFKKVIWYKVNYSRYLEEKKKETNECKNIEYTQEDRNTYGTTIPIEVNSLGDICFRWCDDIQSINIPTNVSKIGDKYFEYCTSLRIINIPTNVSEIGNKCFERCSSLKSINIESAKFITTDNVFFMSLY
ncbi:leucine rich repeat protein BspA family [Entamoeba histolytica]|uniref:Leucine rich repeat protein BspA family n=1 Tax=Entamoeba histolytica TaxID=5759 RepID=A0A175JUP6_ENTHI|nr:leucine rich repeat protein BspA family [Entamoeba histolytica]